MKQRKKAPANEISPEDSFVQHFRLLFEESDRGCVILAVARLDEALEELHRNHIASVSSSSPKLVDSLFSAYAPLSTFAARIKIGRAYALIGKEAFDDFERMRELRNAAAHSSIEVSFNLPELRAQAIALQATKRNVKLIQVTDLTEEERRAVDSPDDSRETAKLYFLMAAMFLEIETIVVRTRLLEKQIQRLRSC